jgi:hypothetical protein
VHPVQPFADPHEPRFRAASRIRASSLGCPAVPHRSKTAIALRSADDKECYYSNNPLPGRSTRSCTITLSRYGQAGRWTVAEFFYGDARGNGRSMTTEMLAAEGYDNGVTVINTGADYTPPVLHGARFTQDTLYAGSGYSQATLRITAGDGPSGVEKVEVGGGSDDGTFMFGGPGGGGGAVLQWGDEWESYLWVDSQHPPAGTIRLNWVRITDRAGNVTELNQQELDARGMRAALTIVR